MIERFGLDGVEPRRRDRQQRRLPAAVLRRARHPGARHRAGRQRRRGRGRAAGIPTAGRVLRRRDRARARRRRQRRPAARQQRARPRARPQRLRRRHEDPARARRRDHDGVPAPAAADRREPVRHDLPRALLVLLVPDRRSASSPPTACGCSTSRSCRRTAARCASSAATPTTRASRTTERARELLDARATRRASSRSRPTSASASAWSSDKRELLAFLIALKRDGQADRRLRRAGQGQHAAQLLRHRHATSSTTRSTATRTSRATSCPARTSRSARPRRSREDRPDFVLILPWNLKDEIIEQLAVHPRVGRRVRGAARRSSTLLP